MKCCGSSRLFFFLSAGPYPVVEMQKGVQCGTERRLRGRKREKVLMKIDCSEFVSSDSCRKTLSSCHFFWSSRVCFASGNRFSIGQIVPCPLPRTWQARKRWFLAKMHPKMINSWDGFAILLCWHFPCWRRTVTTRDTIGWCRNVL